MWCKWLKLMGNKQPEKKVTSHSVPLVQDGLCHGVGQFYFGSKRQKKIEIQHSVHRRLAAGDAYNYHPFLENYFLCRKWLFCGNALKPCNRVNPVPTLTAEMSILHCKWGSPRWYQHKRRKR